MENTRKERTRFAEAIGRVAILTAKGEKPDSAVIQQYWIALKGFNIDTIEQVAEEICAKETDLVAVPPPGRWREIAGQLFELRPRQPRRPGERSKCDVCDDTGYRIRYTEQGVRFVESCQHDGTPNEEPPSFRHHPVSMFDLEGEIGPPPDGKESDLARQRREHGNLLLHCACCGAPYRLRQGMRCVCAVPKGWTVAQWVRLSHVDCPNPSPDAVGKGNSRCRNHCLCTLEQRREHKPKFFPLPEEGEHVDAFLKRQGLRAPDAPAPDDEPPIPEPPPGYDEDLGF